MQSGTKQNLAIATSFTAFCITLCLIQVKLKIYRILKLLITNLNEFKERKIS